MRYVTDKSVQIFHRYVADRRSISVHLVRVVTCHGVWNFCGCIPLLARKLLVALPLHQEPGQTGIDRGQSLAQKPRSARPRPGWPGDKNPGKPRLAWPIP